MTEHKDIDSSVAQQFIDFFHKYQNSIDGSESWFDTSAEGSLHYWECDGDEYLNWKDKGYRHLFNILMKSFPDPSKEIPIMDKILLNKTVSSIDWSCDETNKFVEVKCTDGSSYEADHVICTVSLGVLKEKHLEMFTPKLPEMKKNAIEGLTIGTVDKIFLEFEEPFWPEDWTGFGMFWNKEDLDEIRKMKNNWMEDVYGFFVDNQPNVLCGWVSGKNARIMEETPENEVLEAAMFLIRKFLVKFNNIPDPIRMER